MYKTIFFVHKSADESVKQAMSERVIPTLNELFKLKIDTGKVENNLLNEVNYDLFFEINCENKSEFDRLMNSQPGRNVSKELAGFFNDVTIYSIEFPEKK